MVQYHKQVNRLHTLQQDLDQSCRDDLDLIINVILLPTPSVQKPAGFMRLWNFSMVPKPPKPPMTSGTGGTLSDRRYDRPVCRFASIDARIFIA